MENELFAWVKARDEQTVVPYPGRGGQVPHDQPIRVPRSQYWKRRIKDGSVLEVQAPVQVDETQAPKEGEE